MNDWAVGLSTGCFWQTSIFECLEEIRNAGFGRLEICSARGHLDYHDFDQVRRATQALDELRLESYSFHAPYAEGIDISSPDLDVRNVALRELIQAAEAASILKVRYFVIHPGPEKCGIPEHERFCRLENAAGALKQLYVHCRRLGIGLVLENMLPHLFAGRIRDLLRIMGALDATEVGICLDTGHAYLGQNLANAVHNLSGHLWMVHASDNHGHADDHLPPGDGAIDWRDLLLKLTDLGFSGTFILEVAYLGNRKTTLEAACRGRKYLRDLSHRLRVPGRAQ